jgi:hypothetical protein
VMVASRPKVSLARWQHQSQKLCIAVCKLCSKNL